MPALVTGFSVAFDGPADRYACYRCKHRLQDGDQARGIQCNRVYILVVGGQDLQCPQEGSQGFYTCRDCYEKVVKKTRYIKPSEEVMKKAGLGWGIEPSEYLPRDPNPNEELWWEDKEEYGSDILNADWDIHL